MDVNCICAISESVFWLLENYIPSYTLDFQFWLDALITSINWICKVDKKVLQEESLAHLVEKVDIQPSHLDSSLHENIFVFYD
jgi:hypothetical protein